MKPEELFWSKTDLLFEQAVLSQTVNSLIVISLFRLNYTTGISTTVRVLFILWFGHRLTHLNVLLSWTNSLKLFRIMISCKLMEDVKEKCNQSNESSTLFAMVETVCNLNCTKRQPDELMDNRSTGPSVCIYSHDIIRCRLSIGNF